MRIRLRWRFACLVLLGALFPALLSAGQAQSEFIFLNEIKPGMVGHGLTVVEGDRIERFTVAVLGVDEDGYIVARIGGPAIERSGGVAAGMSGSPIYLDNRLAGALSMAAYFEPYPPEPLALITPIERMLEVLERQGTNPVTSLEATTAGSLLAYVGVGLSPRAVSAMRERGLPGLQAVPSSATALPPMLDLIPGAPVAVLLADGDFQVGAVGTVTYRKDSFVLAFGHPFLQEGPVQWGLGPAWVWTTVRSREQPWKYVSPGHVIGTLLQDRSAAVLGRLDVVPVGEQMTFEVEYAERYGGPSQAKTFTLTNFPSQRVVWLPSLLLMNAVDDVSDRWGPGTATIVLEAQGLDYGGQPWHLRLEDTLTDDDDISYYGVASWFDTIYEALVRNPFEPVRVASMKVTVRAWGVVRVADLARAHLAEGHDVAILPLSDGTVEKIVLPPNPTGCWELEAPDPDLRRWTLSNIAEEATTFPEMLRVLEELPNGSTVFVDGQPYQLAAAVAVGLTSLCR